MSASIDCKLVLFPSIITDEGLNSSLSSLSREPSTSATSLSDWSPGFMLFVRSVCKHIQCSTGRESIQWSYQRVAEPPCLGCRVWDRGGCRISWLEGQAQKIRAKTRVCWCERTYQCSFQRIIIVSSCIHAITVVTVVTVVAVGLEVLAQYRV